jgi:acyl-CoA dehydrogenase
VSDDANEIDELLLDSAVSLFRRHSSLASVLEVAPGSWSPALWSVVEAAELPLVAVSEGSGGSGGTIAQWAIVLRTAAHYCAPIPLAETAIAGWLLDQVGADVPAGPLSAVEVTVADGQAITVGGVPYARDATALVVLARRGEAWEVSLLPRDRYEADPATNIAGEPRDTIRFLASDLADRWPAEAAAGDALALRWAFARSVQIAGALDALLEQTLEYARTRVQFGTPIGRLPVLRDRLALLAEEVAAAGAAADCAVDGLADASVLVVGSAKVRTGEAAGAGARLAHQVHGAVGMTMEYPLHLLTRRLWAWREEAGNERWWAERVGRILVEAGGDGLWPALVRSGGLSVG